MVFRLKPRLDVFRVDVWPAALLLSCSLLPGAALAQGEPEHIRQALEAERRQVELIARLAPAVAAVFQGGPEDEPQGGGSGVLIDPAGWVLTNFHVTATSNVLTIGLNDGNTY